MATSVSRIDPGRFSWSADIGAASQVRRVLAAAAAADGRCPVNEATLLSLRHTGLAGASLWTAERAGQVSGFALSQLGPRIPGNAATVEANLVVAPASRGHGVGRTLARHLVDDLPETPILAWAHGNHPAASALAASFGFTRERDLWLMRRSLREPLPAARVPDGVRVRTFVPDRDEQAFLASNAAAFAAHPEQGGLTRADLERRMAEPWFVPDGFFLAVPDGASGEPDGSTAGEVLGFHWTKQHAGRPPYGEVYVLGVTPTAQGRGLGKVLTLIGLRHLASRGLTEVVLYVEADNAAGIAMYQRLGFTHAERDTDVRYARRGGPSQ